MARYIDADKIDYTMASVYWGKDNKGRDVYRRTFVAFQSDVDELPAADVVPRSEVVELEKALAKCLPSYCQAISEEKAIELGKKYGRREAAREILDWIERSMVIYNPEIPGLRSISMNVFNAIKKKYTEEEK